MGKLPEAKKTYHEVLKINPDYLAAHYGLGVVHNQLEEYEEAIERYHKVADSKPDFAEVRYRLGIVYFITEKYEECIDAFKETIRIIPEHSEAHFNLSAAYDKVGDGKNSIIHMTIAELVFGQKGDQNRQQQCKEQLLQLYPKYNYTPEDFCLPPLSE